MCWVKAPVSLYCSERQSIMKKLLLHFYWCTTDTHAHTHTRRQVSWVCGGPLGILEHSSNVKDACCVFIHRVKPVEISENTSTTDCLHSQHILLFYLGNGDKLVFVGRLRTPPPVLSDTESVKSKRWVTKEERASIVRAPRALQRRS